MRLLEIDQINESFKDAKRIFLKASGDENEVIEYINLFKDLVARNIIRGEERDIGYWIKRGWNQFIKFVNENKDAFTKSDIKRRYAHAEEDFIQVYRSSNVEIVIPLTLHASCYWGKGTQWCTSKLTDENAFFEYVVYHNATIFYVLTPDQKFAVLYDANDDRFTQIQDSEQSEEQGIKTYEFNEILEKYDDLSLEFFSMTANQPDIKSKVEASRNALIQEAIRKIEADELPIDAGYNLFIEGVIDKNQMKKLLLKSKNTFPVTYVLLVTKKLDQQEFMDITERTIHKNFKLDEWLIMNPFEALWAATNDNRYTEIDIEWFKKILVQYADNKDAMWYAGLLVKEGHATEEWFDKHWNK